MKILLIAGHGAGDPGASGCGYKEANLTRELVNLIAPNLRKYATEIGRASCRERVCGMV